MSRGLPLEVDCLVDRDCVEPGPKLSRRIKLVTLQMDLEKRLLKDVVGQLAIAQAFPKVPVKLSLVPVNQLLECPAISLVAVFQQKVLVRAHRS